MTYEDTYRCRYWPECTVHLAVDRHMVDVSEEERIQLFNAYLHGASVAELSADSGLNYSGLLRLMQSYKRKMESNVPLQWYSTGPEPKRPRELQLEYRKVRRL